MHGRSYIWKPIGISANLRKKNYSIPKNLVPTMLNTDMFLTEYIVLAIHLNSQGALSDMVLNKVKENANLMV